MDEIQIFLVYWLIGHILVGNRILLTAFMAIIVTKHKDHLHKKSLLSKLIISDYLEIYGSYLFGIALWPFVLLPLIAEKKKIDRLDI